MGVDIDRSTWRVGLSDKFDKVQPDRVVYESPLRLTSGAVIKSIAIEGPGDDGTDYTTQNRITDSLEEELRLGRNKKLRIHFESALLHSPSAQQIIHKYLGPEGEVGWLDQADPDRPQMPASSSKAPHHSRQAHVAISDADIRLLDHDTTLTTRHTSTVASKLRVMHAAAKADRASRLMEQRRVLEEEDDEANEGEDNELTRATSTSFEAPSNSTSTARQAGMLAAQVKLDSAYESQKELYDQVLFSLFIRRDSELTALATSVTDKLLGKSRFSDLLRNVEEDPLFQEWKRGSTDPLVVALRDEEDMDLFDDTVLRQVYEEAAAGHVDHLQDQPAAGRASSVPLGPSSRVMDDQAAALVKRSVRAKTATSSEGPRGGSTKRSFAGPQALRRKLKLIHIPFEAVDGSSNVVDSTKSFGGFSGAEVLIICYLVYNVGTKVLFSRLLQFGRSA